MPYHNFLSCAKTEIEDLTVLIQYVYNKEKQNNTRLNLKNMTFCPYKLVGWTKLDKKK